MHARSLVAFLAASAALAAPAPTQTKAPRPGERIALIGNGLAERMLYFGHFETQLHQRYPEHRLVLRNMARSGDTAGFRPHSSRRSQWAFPGAEKFHPRYRQHHGQGFFPTPDQWLTAVKADTILAFFGYNEAFDGADGLLGFSAELDAFARHTLAQKYNGAAAPRLVLVSPIRFEDLSATRDLPDGKRINADLARYASAMARVAKTHGATFVDLFAWTSAAYARDRRDYTINGFAPSDYGYRQLAPVLCDLAFGPQPPRSVANPETLRRMVLDKDWFWFNDYQVLNGVHVYGRRHQPFGPANYPTELQKTREMTLLRETRIHEIAMGKTRELEVDDAKTRALAKVESNFKRPIRYLGAKSALSKFQLRDGFAINLFASEQEFPDLENPVQMSFDNRGRLWVAVAPSYPHYQPGDPRPDDKLIILEDTDGDGRADRQKVFAAGLHLPIGFELAPEGVYLSQQPNLCLLVDDDRDDRADRMEILLSGFDSHDTHHAISAYCADASGAFYLGEGRFLHSQVETPYGPQRGNDGGVWRFDPKSHRLERYSQSDYNNPWGITFDAWEQCFIADASDGHNYWALPLSAKMPYGVELPKVGQFAPKRARPTSGTEFVSSRHFPDELQGHFMICNSIGFLGTSLHDVWEDGAGFAGKHIGDLVSSSDPNFRPVDIEFGPDGALYLVDWHNALIGHMQHNARDPQRDHDHGRIYRISHKTRPLLQPAKIAGASITQLLDNLKLPEYRSRYRTRRELRGRPREAVLTEIRKWVPGLDPEHHDHERRLCEALWATWAQNQVDGALLARLLDAKAHQARAAATHVLRYAWRQVPNALELLLKAADDPHGRVRMEAFVAASWLDNQAGARIALQALRHPFDRHMGKVFEHIIQHTLADDVQALRATDPAVLTDNPSARAYLAGEFKLVAAQPKREPSVGPTRELTRAERKIYRLGKEVFHRPGHCVTCHQKDGKGLAKIYPPITESPWVSGNPERLIKITLKGIWGPIEVHGKTYDPSQGVPPMTGFEGLLDNRELAAVLSYVRTSFGNQASFITPAQVLAVRIATEGKNGYYTVKEILKAHPLQQRTRPDRK